MVNASVTWPWSYYMHIYLFLSAIRTISFYVNHTKISKLRFTSQNTQPSPTISITTTKALPLPLPLPSSLLRCHPHIKPGLFGRRWQEGGDRVKDGPRDGWVRTIAPTNVQTFTRKTTICLYAPRVIGSWRVHLLRCWVGKWPQKMKSCFLNFVPNYGQFGSRFAQNHLDGDLFASEFDLNPIIPTPIKTGVYFLFPFCNCLMLWLWRTFNWAWNIRSKPMVQPGLGYLEQAFAKFIFLEF